MSIPVPLGVRLHRGLGHTVNPIDQWVTRWVDDVTFRSVIPGGFASATITLRLPRSEARQVITGTATGTGTSITPDYLVASDADAADVAVGDRVWIYDSGGTVRFGGARFRVTSKNSAFGFTNIFFTPNATASTVSGDVMRATKSAVLHDPNPQGLSTALPDLFNRIQIVDLRCGETVWEGRVEDPARQVEPDVWQIGALGSMVAASDINRPVFYIDSSIENWVPAHDGVLFGFPDFPWDDGSQDKDETNQSFIFQMTPEDGWIFSAGNFVVPYIWNAAPAYGQYIARFTTTHSGRGPNTAQDQNFSIAHEFAGNDAIDVTGFEVAEQTKSNTIGTDFTSEFEQTIYLRVRRDAGVGDWTVPANLTHITWFAQWRKPKVLALRMDRNGNTLNTAASYPGDYVTVSQVVEDVAGRFLVEGWSTLTANNPWPGLVRTSDMYLDTSDTTQIVHLMYPDGVTAAQILTDLVEQVQTQAYWAIWESRTRSSIETLADAGYRFEWSQWPDEWGYYVTTQDGYEGQPNGEDIFNYVFYKYPDTDDGEMTHLTEAVHTNIGTSMAPELRAGQVTRAATVTRESPTTSTTADTAATAWLDAHRKPLNAGTVTVSRPVHLFDDGSTSWSGAAKTLDPWQVRPGKLVRITDVLPRTRVLGVSNGDWIDGVKFRVVATEYSSADNTVRLELDQPARWQTSQQIVAGAKPKTIVLK